MSVAQDTDIASHQAKYKAWESQKARNEKVILYGVSRGAATTFNAMARHHYKDVKLVVLEGCFYSLNDVLKRRYFKPLASLVEYALSFLSYKQNGPSPVKSVEDFPPDVPVVFISSKIDKEVPYDSVLKLAQELADKGKNPVYLLTLENSSHPNYMFDDSKDRFKYEAFINAVYQEYDLPHDEALAQKGLQYLQESKLKPKIEQAQLHLPAAESNELNFKDIFRKLALFGLTAAAIQRIATAFYSMTDPQQRQAAYAFLSEVTAQKSVREAYYQHSDYIAEFFCTLSNLGFFAVAYHYKDYAALLAGTFSALSHAIPSQRLHDLDMLGVFIALFKVAMNYKVLLDNPDVLAVGAGALALNGLDTFIARFFPEQVETISPVIHSCWHLGAAYALHRLNHAATATVPADQALIEAGASVSSNSP